MEECEGRAIVSLADAEGASQARRPEEPKSLNIADVRAASRLSCALKKIRAETASDYKN